MIKKLGFIYIVVIGSLFFSACTISSRHSSKLTDIKLSYANETRTILKTIASNSIDKPLLIQAIDRLGKIGRGEVVKLKLMSLFVSKDEDIKLASLQALQLLMGREALILYMDEATYSDYRKRLRALSSFVALDEKLYNRYEVYKILINALQDKKEDVRYQALYVLGRRKEKRAISALMNLLLKEKEIVKFNIIDTLVIMGKSSIPFMLENISKPEWKDDLSYLMAGLLKIGHFISEDTLPVLLNTKKTVMLEFLQKIRRHIIKNGSGDFLISDDRSIHYYLNEMLKQEKDPKIAVAIIQIMINIGADDPFLKDVLVTIFDRLNDKAEDGLVQSYASSLFMVLNTELSAHIMIKFLETAGVEGKRNIINIFRKIGLPKFIQPLKGLLQDKELEDEVYTVLVNIHDPSTIPLFIEILKKNDMSKTKYAVRGLRSIGSPAASEVVKLLTDKQTHVRLNAIHILYSIATLKEVPFLIEALDDKKMTISKISALTLGGLGAKEAIPKLIKLMIEDTVTLQLNQAAKAIELMGKKAVPSLLNLMKSKGHKEKVYAAWVLAKIGSREALDPIKKLVSEVSNSNIYVMVTSKDPTSYALVQGDALSESLRIIEKKIGK